LFFKDHFGNIGNGDFPFMDDVEDFMEMDEERYEGF
jgi:hypothetical protein